MDNQPRRKLLPCRLWMGSLTVRMSNDKHCKTHRHLNLSDVGPESLTYRPMSSSASPGDKTLNMIILTPLYREWKQQRFEAAQFPL
jgi:hypothetical protein